MADPSRKAPSPSSRPRRRRGRAAASGPEGQDQRLYGIHAVAAAWANPARRCRRLWATEAAWQEVCQTVPNPASDRPHPKIADRDVLDGLVPAGGVHQGVVLEADPLPQRPLGEIVKDLPPTDPALLIVLDQVTDPHNVGAILRSAAVFGAKAVIVQNRNTPAVTGALAKSASGAVEHVPLVRVTNIARSLRHLRESAFTCLGLAEEADTDIGEATIPGGRAALVLGAEGPGLRRLTRETCDLLIKLPARGPIRSLNVSNAAAVALYALTTTAPAGGGPPG